MVTNATVGDSIGSVVNDVYEGDAAAVLREFPASRVHFAMTSPPYYQVRDYESEKQIGREDRVAEFVAELVRVGEALKRVLRDDGNWFLNIGDSFAGSTQECRRRDVIDPKDKLLVPHRVAIALQEAGWVVRGDYIWAKTDPKPSSTKDRLTETKEYIFHLTPTGDYVEAGAKPRPSGRGYAPYTFTLLSQHLPPPASNVRSPNKGKNMAGWIGFRLSQDESKSQPSPGWHSPRGFDGECGRWRGPWPTALDGRGDHAPPSGGAGHSERIHNPPHPAKGRRSVHKPAS